MLFPGHLQPNNRHNLPFLHIITANRQQDTNLDVLTKHNMVHIKQVLLTSLLLPGFDTTTRSLCHCHHHGVHHIINMPQHCQSFLRYFRSPSISASLVSGKTPHHGRMSRHHRYTPHHIQQMKKTLPCSIR